MRETSRIVLFALDKMWFFFT